MTASDEKKTPTDDKNTGRPLPDGEACSRRAETQAGAGGSRKGTARYRRDAT